LRYNPTTGNQNFLINGGQDIWQRGTTFTGTGWAFASDRWAYLSLGGNSTLTQETSVVPAGFKYSTKFTAGATITGYLSQSIETFNTLQLAGKTIAFSAQVAATTSIPLQLVVEFSTTVDASSGGSWTGITATSGSTATPTSTTFIPISGIFAIPSNAQTVRAYVRTQNTITSGQAFYFGGSKLEIGSIPTTFTKSGGTIQGELAAAQRYCYVYSAGSLPTEIRSSTTGYSFMKLPVTMRTAPSVTYSSASSYSVNSAGKTGTITSISTDTAAVDTLSMALGFSGYTAGQAGTFFSSGSTTISAEL